MKNHGQVNRCLSVSAHFPKVQRLDKNVEILDTTLRDGRQNIRATISEPDMLELVKMLDNFGVHMIELGFPSRSSKDMKAFNLIQAATLHNLQDPHSKALEPDCLSPILAITTQSPRGEG